MKKKIPTFKSDRAAEAFMATADLSEYYLSDAQLVRFEMKHKIGSFEAFKAMTVAAVRGEHKPDPDEPKIWVEAVEGAEPRNVLHDRHAGGAPPARRQDAKRADEP